MLDDLLISSFFTQQIDAFRGIRNSSGEPMADHCRPPCPLNGRSIRSCTIQDIGAAENCQDGNNNLVENSDADKENELPDENAKYCRNDTDPDVTGKSQYFGDIYKLEAMTNHAAEWCSLFSIYKKKRMWNKAIR